MIDQSGMPAGYTLHYDSQIGYWWYHPDTDTSGKIGSRLEAMKDVYRHSRAARKVDPVAECLDYKAMRKSRHETIRAHAYQHRLMADHGFPKAFCTKALGLPRAYESTCGQWRISTAPEHKWKLEHWIGRMYYPPGHYFGNGLKVWTATPKRFDTPLAVALWFNMMRPHYEP